MALSNYLDPNLEQKLNEGLGPLSQAITAGQTQPTVPQSPMQTQSKDKGALFLKAAEMAAMGGLNEHANQFLKLAKMHGVGGSDDVEEGQIVDMADPQDPRKTIKVLVSRRTGLPIRKVGDVPSESFKFTGASTFRGGDGRWWRWNPTTGDPEFHEGGKWKSDPNVPVPDAVPKELGRTPAGELNKAVQMDTIRGNIARIRENKNDEWLGPVAGRAYAVQEALTGLKDPMQSTFYADVNDLGDMLLRARSGAQINEQEYTRLRKLVPTPNLPPKVFAERLNRFETQLMQALEAQQRRLSGSRYMAPSPTPMSPALVTGGTPKQDLSKMSDEELLKLLNQ